MLVVPPTTEMDSVLEPFKEDLIGSPVFFRTSPGVASAAAAERVAAVETVRRGAERAGSIVSTSASTTESETCRVCMAGASTLSRSLSALLGVLRS